MPLLALVMSGGAWSQPQAPGSEILEIDLPTALRLADERNLDVAIYVERIAEASARLAQAQTLAVPTLSVGGNYDRHTGNIQETSGQVVDVERVARFTGLSAGLRVDVADAIFAPLLARQNRAAVMAASTANRHEVFVDVATAYMRLLQSRAEGGVVQSALQRAVDLATLTANYAEAGEGLLADAEMAAVQPMLWQQRRLVTEERAEAAAAELVRLLHLDAGAMLEPLETRIPVLEIYSIDEDVERLIARALTERPETEQYDALVAAAEDDLSAQRYGLFIPGIALDYGTGEFGGAPGSSVQDTDHRDDLMLSLYWQFEGFGLGHRARTNEKRAQLRRLGLERDKLRDGIAAEVRASYARVRSLAQQLEFTDAAVERAAQAYLLNRARIYDRQGLPLEALQAMQTLAAAELAQLETRISYTLAQIRLHTALGNPLDSQF
ncbi:MAG TPA: TolC family protein [Steroidobacteraceae bacterium]